MKRRRFYKLIITGASLSIAGCSSSDDTQTSNPDQTEPDPGDTETTAPQDEPRGEESATAQPIDVSPLRWHTANRDAGNSRFEPDQTFESTEYGINWQSETGQAADRIISGGERFFFESDTVWAMDSEGNKLWSKLGDDTTYADLHYYDDKLVMLAGEVVLIADAKTGERISVLAETPMTQRTKEFSQMTETGLYVKSDLGLEPNIGVIDVDAEELILDKTYETGVDGMPRYFDPVDIVAEGDTIYALGEAEDTENYNKHTYLVAIDGRSGDVVSVNRMDWKDLAEDRLVKKNDTLVSVIQVESTGVREYKFGLFAFTPDGTITWENRDVTTILSSGTGEKLNLAIDDSNVYVLEEQSAYAFDLSSGDQRWRYNSTKELSGRMLSTSDALLIPDGTHIVRIDKQSGEGERLEVNSNGVPMEWGAGKIRPATNGIYGFGENTYHITKMSEIEGSDE